MTPRIDPRPPRRFGARHALTALLALAPAAVAVAVVLAATAPRTENPHGKLKLECGLCHGAEGWTPARVSPKFDHSKFGFPLSGAHAAASCTTCHTTLDFKQARIACQSCHEDPHQGELGTECARCHDARSFLDRGPMVRAHQMTRFPLTGSHKGLDCESCHPRAAQGGLQFVGTRAECQACHLADYRAANAPDHVAGGFPTTCESCHSTLGWQRARFDHARTAFPLTGAHRTTPCASCHGDGVYRGKSTDCISCHQADYDRASPDHAASGFAASACASCHNTTSWDGAKFDHSTTGFPLTGAHVTTPCASCHGDGVYQGKSTDCASCHQADYDAAVPNHPAAGFPASACATCHNTTAWAGATFDHDQPYFPIYSGRHAGTWSSCSDCHTSATDFSVFTCLSCHPHDDKANTDGQHQGISGYRYDSNACYSCHPSGRAG